MNKKRLYPVLVIAAALALAALIVANPEKKIEEAVETRPISVRVMRVAAGDEYLTISSQGTVQPRSQSELIPEVSGTVTWISPALVGGGVFKEGDVLLRIDDADYRTALEGARARRTRAEVEAEFATDELRRLESLFDKKLASQSQLDTARRAARIAESTLLEARAAQDQAERDLYRTELRAPFDGLVRSEQVDLGQFVSRGNSIGTIYAADYVEVRLPIAADQLTYLGIPVSRQGQIPAEQRPPVTVAADFGKTRVFWEGELERTEAEFDARSRMLFGVTRIPYSRDDKSPVLPVGLFVQAEIRGRRVENVMRLPRSAIRDRDEVLVVDDNNRLHFRPVQVLRLEHDEVLISAGLENGELVCISPLQTVVDGMRVEPVLE